MVGDQNCRKVQNIVSATHLVREALAQLLPSGWYVDAQEPVTTQDSEPEPDVAVVRGIGVNTSTAIPDLKTSPW